MSTPGTITVDELDENLEVSGRRSVRAQQTVIPVYAPPAELARLRIHVTDKLQFVETVEVGWFDAERDVDYALANDSLWYLGMTVRRPGTTEEQYNRAWDIFRKEQVEALAAALGHSSWGFGNGIASRRGQGLFVVELDGLDCPMWSLFLSIRPLDTYAFCWETAQQTEDFFSKHPLEQDSTTAS